MKMLVNVTRYHQLEQCAADLLLAADSATIEGARRAVIQAITRAQEIYSKEAHQCNF